MSETTPDAARLAAQEAFARARKSGTRTTAGCLSAALEAAGPLIRQDEREHADRLRAQIRQMQLAAERKNRELDALHMVWCDGGCPGGVHRWNDALITRELVETAERNTKRLRRWYRCVEFRLSLPGADAWQQKRWRRVAAKTDLLEGPR